MYWINDLCHHLRIYTMTDDTILLENQKTTKRWIWIMTLIYLVPFPILLYASLFSVAILEPTGSKFLQVTFIALCLSIPLSIPPSIYFMWRRYFQRKYPKARFYCVVPIVISVVCYFLIECMGYFFFWASKPIANDLDPKEAVIGYKPMRQPSRYSQTKP
jgi:hypothetical protein